jgi:hypothetical protein
MRKKLGPGGDAKAVEYQKGGDCPFFLKNSLTRIFCSFQKVMSILKGGVTNDRDSILCICSNSSLNWHSVRRLPHLLGFEDAPRVGADD